MAYAYTELEDAMGQGQQNQNVFADQSQSQNPTQQQTQVGGGQTSGLKTNTEGDLTQGGGGSASNQPKSQSQVSTDQSNRNATSAAYKANIGKTQTPAALAGVQTGIDQKSQGLATAAADYSAAQKGKQNYGLDTSILDQAIGNDQGSRAKTSELLNRTTANQADQFNAGDLKVKDADLLQNEEGLKQLAARGQGPQYTPGMAAFDTMLLRRDPAFQSQSQNLQRQANDLAAKGTTEKERLEKEANDYGSQNLLDSQRAAKTYLGNQSEAIKAENTKQAQAANDQLKALDVSGLKGKALADAKAKVKETLDAQFGKGRADEMLNSVQVNPDDYFKVASGYNADQFYSADDANRYNSINSLLGQGGPGVLESGALGDQYSVDQDALYNSLYNPASQGRMAKDVSGQAQLSKILADAQARADADDATRQKRIPNYLSDLNAMGGIFADDPALAAYKQYATPDTINTFSSDYAAKNPLSQEYLSDLGANDVLSQSESDLLNSLSQDLGTGASYGVGKYANGGPADSLNPDSYKKALMEYLSGVKSTTDASSAAAQQAALRQAAELSKQTAKPISSNADVRVNNGSTLNKLEDKLNAGARNLGGILGRRF